MLAAGLFVWLPVAQMASADPISDTRPRCNAGIAVHFSDDPTQWLRAGRIVGDNRAYFRWQIGAECTAEPVNQCMSPGHSYLVPGDLVAVAGTVPGFACVSYAKTAREKRKFFGWIAADQVKIEDPAESKRPLTAWAGSWRNSNATIRIRVDRASLHAEGRAIWRGRGDPHFGEFAYSSVPVGDTVTLGVGGDVGSCQVQLLALGELLVATDNGNCGGANVSFTGFYARKPQ